MHQQNTVSDNNAGINFQTNDSNLSYVIIQCLCDTEYNFDVYSRVCKLSADKTVKTSPDPYVNTINETSSDQQGNNPKTIKNKILEKINYSKPQLKESDFPAKTISNSSTSTRFEASSTENNSISTKIIKQKNIVQKIWEKLLSWF